MHHSCTHSLTCSLVFTCHAYFASQSLVEFVGQLFARFPDAVVPSGSHAVIAESYKPKVRACAYRHVDTVGTLRQPCRAIVCRVVSHVA
jgi:hypothetical protein